MNGKVFLVQEAINQIESEAGATKPEQIKTAHPWMSMKDVKTISPKAGNVSRGDSAKLAKGGLALPTYHFRCRSTVDVSVESGSYTSLSSVDIKTLPKPIPKPLPKPRPRPKPVAKPKAPPPIKRPATMPKQPKARFPTPPTDKQNAVLFSAMSKAMAKSVAGVTVKNHAGRQAIQRLFKDKYKMDTPIHAGRDLVVNKKNVGYLGQMQWHQGRMALDKDIAADLTSAMKRAARGGASSIANEERQALSTFIHEEIHNHTRGGREFYRRGFGQGAAAFDNVRAVEEATTEILAKRITRDIVRQEALPASIPTVKFVPGQRRVVRNRLSPQFAEDQGKWKASGSYSKQVSEVFQAVSDNTKLAPAQVRDAVESAALKFRTQATALPSKQFGEVGAREYVKNFVDQIPDISAAQRKAVLKQVKRLRL
jgi:hypothetical protein